MHVLVCLLSLGNLYVSELHTSVECFTEIGLILALDVLKASSFEMCKKAIPGNDISQAGCNEFKKFFD